MLPRYRQVREQTKSMDFRGPLTAEPMAYLGPSLLQELLAHLPCVRMYLCVPRFVLHVRVCVHRCRHFRSRDRNTSLALQTPSLRVLRLWSPSDLPTVPLVTLCWLSFFPCLPCT